MSLEAFKLLIKLTTSKRKKDTLSHVLLSVKVRFFSDTTLLTLLFQSGTPHDEIVGNSNQLMIVSLYNSEDPCRNHYYIMVEQVMLQDSQSFKETIFLLVAVDYVFNLEYDKSVLEPLLFLQEFVLNLKEKGQRSTVYTAIASRLSRAT